MIWYEKKEFVKKAIDQNHYGSDIFIWMDAGCLRDKKWFDKELFLQTKPFKKIMKPGKVYVGELGAPFKKLVYDEH